ncbi:transposase family protein [Micromonospora sp. NPDC005173]|uniref:transposase family protein n=1 Tax=Micromonospora sp. NPDC005173 TaxID=3157165 RepID=UPI0033B4D812
MAEAAACPECGQPARRVHAYHLRRLADFPIAGRGVIVELRVRRMSDPRLPAADLPGTVARDSVAAYPAVDRVDRGHRSSAGWSRWRGGAVPVGGSASRAPRCCGCSWHCRSPRSRFRRC